MKILKIIKKREKRGTVCFDHSPASSVYAGVCEATELCSCRHMCQVFTPRRHLGQIWRRQGRECVPFVAIIGKQKNVFVFQASCEGIAMCNSTESIQSAFPLGDLMILVSC